MLLILFLPYWVQASNHHFCITLQDDLLSHWWTHSLEIMKMSYTYAYKYYDMSSLLPLCRLLTGERYAHLAALPPRICLANLLNLELSIWILRICSSLSRSLPLCIDSGAI